jgi:carboxylate-amine ligase
VKLHRLYTRNMGFRMYHRALIEENKWRAARWGIEGKLIDFGKQAEVPMAVLIEELFEFVDDVLDELGSRASLEPIRGIVRHGTSAERQLRVHKETGDLQAVVRHIVAETREGVSLPAGSAASAPQVS